MVREDGLLDRIARALGLGRHDEPEAQRGIDMERPLSTASPAALERLGEINGAEAVAAREGISGGFGASGAMGGAGAGGAAGVTGLEAYDPAAPATTADAGRVLTEYEMGYESDAALERVAESGASRPTSERVEP